jgi:PAS domain S-box-containing protein
MTRDETLHLAGAAGAPHGERMLSAILQSLSEAVFTVDRDHRISSFNRSAERRFGIPAGEALGKDCRRVLRASFGPAQHDCPMGDLKEGGKPRSDVDGTLVLADGRIVPVSASWDFFEDDDGERLGFVISFRSFEEIERLAEERKGKFPFRDIVGKTPRIRQIFDMIDMVKDTDSTVLVTGESGTGKGLFARAIHDLSPRREGPFVKVNCAALTETLLESELFGHIRGAFTGAIADKVGRFEAAGGGTIFLDEIGKSPRFAGKLLRVLQDREYERVGSSKTQSVDLRVIAATNRDLKAAMASGQFRGDLFTGSTSFRSPSPLRERRRISPSRRPRAEAPEAARAGKGQGGVAEAMRCLMEYPWPGNIRELENVLERGMVCARGRVLSMEDLPDELRESCRPRRESPPAMPSGGGAVDSPQSDTRAGVEEEGERGNLLQTLDMHRWNRKDAAAALGIDRSTLWRRMKRLGIA